MPISPIISIPPLPAAFPSDCRFIGSRTGDMQTLGQKVGISVYKDLYLNTGGGAYPVPAEGNGWESDRVIKRFTEQGIVHRHKAKLYLRALPASPQVLNEEIPQRVRVGLVVACWGMLSSVRLAELAWVKHTDLHSSSPLLKFALELSFDGANQNNAKSSLKMLVIETASEHITPQKISDAIARKGAAYWITWYNPLGQFLYFQRGARGGCLSLPFGHQFKGHFAILHA